MPGQRQGDVPERAARRRCRGRATRPAAAPSMRSSVANSGTMKNGTYPYASAMMTVYGFPDSQSTGLGDYVHASRRPVHVPVGLQQVDPGQHPGQVVDPPRREDQRQQQAAAPAGVPGHVVGDRVADRRCTSPARRPRSTKVRTKTGRRSPVTERCSTLAECRRTATAAGSTPAPVEPNSGSVVAEGDRRDRVERHDEEDQEPGRARQRQVPATAGRRAGRCSPLVHQQSLSARLEGCPDVVPHRDAGRAQLQQLAAGVVLLGVTIVDLQVARARTPRRPCSPGVNFCSAGW